MKVVLELLDQNSNIKKVTVRHDIVIGRGAECNLRLSAPQVSRRHCFLRISDEGAFVSDLDSSNGTFLNGQRLTSGTRVELINGATFAVGPVKFVAHVRSEILASEALRVEIADDRIQAGSGADIEEAGQNYNATVAHSIDKHDQMDFAIEHVGPSAGEDDPTADYVSTHSGTPTFFKEPGNDELPDLDSSGSDALLVFPASEDDAPTVASSGSISDAIIESVEIISIKDGDMLVVDDLDVADVTAEPTIANKPPVEEDDDETELRDFLSGLE